MNARDLTSMLDGHRSALETAQWLRATYLPSLIDRFNTDDVRKRIGLYQGEVIPANERNLTDVRNRVSLIVEYELARVSNQILVDAGIQDTFWAYVVANRFPDLEIRKNNGNRGLRIEVKCLQSIAEEKSANFDTLKKDINPNTDFVVVFLWEWAYRDSTTFHWDRSPKLNDCYVFHALSLATLRDTYWLNRPPDNLGGGYQGFDLRYAVNCRDGTYAEEEGNYGKLLRIWQSDFAYRPPESALISDTEREYARFKQGVILDGFWNLCDFHLPRLSEQANVEQIYLQESPVGKKAGRYAFFSKSILSQNEAVVLMRAQGLKYGVLMTEKYVCTGIEVLEVGIEHKFRRVKPKYLTRDLFGLA